jgi:serine/threonine protein kinase
MEDLKPSDPTEIGDFKVLKRLGAGGFGVVFLATDPKGRRVALKVLRPEYSDDQRLRERLAKEARSLSAVKGTRTAKLIGVGSADSYAFLAMEYVEGESLDKLVTGGRRPEGAMLWFLALGLVEALEEIHSAGVIHRDLKPSNVILGPEGVKVVDFGISAILDEGGFTQTGSMVGTATWLSPEQISGAKIDERSDIFALGMLLAYVGLGRHPYGDGRPDAVMYRITNTNPDLSQLPNPFRLAVSRCLSRDPSERPTIASLRSFFESGGSASSEVALQESGTPDSTFLVQPSDMDEAARRSKSAAETTTYGQRRGRPTRVLVGVVTVLGLGVGVVATLDATNVADLGIIVEPEASASSEPPATTPSSSPTTVGIARTTTTTQPPPPAYKLLEFEGVQVRWNPCDGPISIYLNTAGKLRPAQEASVARFLSKTAIELTEMTGLVVLYAGATSDKTRNAYRSGERILIQIDSPGNGILPSSDSEYIGQTFLSMDRSRRGFREIDHFDIHINSDLFTPTFFSGSEVNTYGKRILMRYLGQGMGLEYLEDADMIGFGIDDSDQMNNEIMYWGPAIPPSVSEPKWGPGDQLGMVLVGATNGCF